MQNIELKTLSLPNGETFGYRESGNGSTNILLIHGNMTSSKHWDLFISNLPEEYKVFAMDLRGFGISSYKKPITSIKDLADDVSLFVDELKIPEFTLGGWSTGGSVALQFAADHPSRVKKMVLIESVGIAGYPIYRKNKHLESIPGELIRTKEELANDPLQLRISKAFDEKDKVFFMNLWDSLIYTQNKPDPEKYEEYLDDILTQRNSLDIAFALMTFNISNYYNGLIEGTEDIKKITMPTIIIHGENDLVIPLEKAIELARAIGDKAKLVILEKSGHSPMVDCLEKLIGIFVKFVGLPSHFRRNEYE